jgi:hypothetical protein
MEPKTMARWPTASQKKRLFEAFGYTPSALQAPAHRMVRPRLGLPQVGLILGGERAGKSHVAGHEAAALALWSDLVFIAGVEYENCEPEFEYMVGALERIGAMAWTSTPRHGRWVAELRTGCEIRTISFVRRGPDALIATGKAPDVVLLSEAGLVQFSHFQAAFTRVTEKRGVVLATGTLKAALPWYAEKYRQFLGDNPYNGRAVSLPSWGNPVVYPGGRSDPVIQAVEETFSSGRLEWMFQERFAAEPVPSGLLVFGRQFSHEMHVRRCEYDADLPVEVAIDPGYAGAYAVEVMQWTGSADVRVVDEFYEQYATWHQAVAWLRALPYGERIKTGVGDVAIHQHHADRSQYENWMASGVVLRSQAVGIREGIDRMRDFLVSPFSGTARIQFDPRCTGILWEFGRESYPAGPDGEPVRETPIDAHNHARKAISYWLVDHFGFSDVEPPAPTPGKPDRYRAKRGKRTKGTRGRAERFVKRK